jgi:hypothetical protein
LVLLLLVASGCSRCGAPSGPVDAGQHKRAVGDVRTALLFTFPEYRGVFVERSGAAVTRRYTKLPADFAKTGTSNLAWVADADGGWHVSAFYVEQLSADTLRLGFTLDNERVHRLFEAPIGASSMELGLYLPRENIAHETFVFDVAYVTAPARAAFLVRQLATLLLANQQWSATLPAGWEQLAPDGGPQAPDPLELTFTAQQDGATVHVVRQGGRVSVHYELVTDELLP